MKDVNQMTTRQKIEHAVNLFKEMDYKEFTVVDICTLLELDHKRNSRSYKNINNMIRKMADNQSLYMMKKTKPRTSALKGGRGYNIYTYDKSYCEFENDVIVLDNPKCSQEKPIAKNEQKITLLEIGDAIMTKMLQLQETVDRLQKQALIDKGFLEETEKDMEKQNELIIKLNSELEKVKKEKEKETSSQGVFKLEDIATFK